MSTQDLEQQLSALQAKISTIREVAGGLWAVAKQTNEQIEQLYLDLETLEQKTDPTVKNKVNAKRRS